MNKKRIAELSLFAIILKLIYHLWSVWLTHWQLVSPIIPEDVVKTISEPHLMASITLSLTLIPAFLFYLFAKYLGTLITVALGILLSGTWLLQNLLHF